MFNAILKLIFFSVLFYLICIIEITNVKSTRCIWKCYRNNQEYGTLHFQKKKVDISTNIQTIHFLTYTMYFYFWVYNLTTWIAYTSNFSPCKSCVRSRNLNPLPESYQHCKEIEQETCYNKPQASRKPTQVIKFIKCTVDCSSRIECPV